MPWKARLSRAERAVAAETADPAARLTVLAEQQAEVAQELRDIVTQLRREENQHHD